MDITDEGYERGGGEEPDSGDGLEALGDGIIPGEGLDLALGVAGAGFEESDLRAGLVECGSQSRGDGPLGIFDQGQNGWDDMVSALRDEDADFPEHASGSVDSGGAVGDVSAAIPVQSSQDMLIEGFDGYRMDVFVAERLKERFGIGAVGLVACGVGAGGVRREQDDGVAQLLKFSSPMVGGAAGFEEDGCWLTFGEETLEAGTREAMALAHAAGVVGDGDLEN